MTTNGKILFFSESDGKGIIIDSNREKIEFVVQDWDDYEVMPSLGLEVLFDFIDFKAINIISKQSSENLKLQIPELSEVDVDTETYEKVEIEIEKKDPNYDDILEKKNNEEENHESIINEIEKLKEIESLPEIKKQENILENEQNIDEEDIEEEIQERPDVITISLNIKSSVSSYFNTINIELKKRDAYKKVNGKLNYVLAKRFLFTTFNNLTDLDLHIITPKIKMLHKDLKQMSNVYDDFVNKTRYPHLAFKEVFLTCQSEYMKIKNGAEYTIEKLSQLRGNEKVMGADLEVKKEELDKNINSAEFTALQHEMKSLNGAYVDVVHMMAELDEKYKEDMKILDEFEDEYREDFYELFDIESTFYKKKLLEILDAQAYIFDAQLWLQARKSKSIKAHFKKSSIDGGFNTKTYLKYFLDTQDSAKATEDTKKLFDLYKHLQEVQKDYILIVVSSVNDAMEYEASIKMLKKSYNIKSFISPKSALKWALTNSIKVLIIEDLVQQIRVEKFLYIYDKNIFLKPKIILLGNKPAKSPYSISRLLSKEASAKDIADSVKAVMQE